MSDIDRAIAMIELRIQYLQDVIMYGPEGIREVKNGPVTTLTGLVWLGPRPWLQPDYPFPTTDTPNVPLEDAAA